MRIIEGDTFTFPAGDGVEVVLDSGEGAGPLSRLAADGAAAFERLTPGRYWIAVREGGRSTRCGTLDVEPLADPRGVRLRRELDALDAEIADLARAVQEQETDGSSGLTRSRTRLAELRRQRAFAEARLGDYDRRLRGEGPWR